MLALNAVTRVFRTDTVETTAVDGVSLAVSPGEILAIVGRSGSGKSTLAAIMGLLDRPTNGSVIFDGVDLTHATDTALAKVRRTKISFVFQSFHLIPHMSVLQNVSLALDGLNMDAQSRVQAADAALSRLGLGSRTAHFPPQLSGGQQQRVAIARALVRTPRLLICDEPTGNLDTENAQNVIDLLAGARESGTSVVVVTHDAEVARMADRVLRMADGRLAAGSA